MMRLHKFLAEAGLASRRAGERMILDGRVSVNGVIVRTLGTKVEPGRDRVALDGALVRARHKLYVAVHKPPGVVCTRSDPEGRRTVGDLLPAEWNHLFPVGRLDYASEGLIFLTNDGDFCLKLTHPRFGVLKVYQAEVAGRVGPELPARLREGIREGGEKLRADTARILASNNTRSLIELALAEGKNREVRRLLGALGLKVERLARIRIGPIPLGELRPGRWRTLTEPEIESLLAAYENNTATFHGVHRGARPAPGRRGRAGSRRRQDQD